MQERSQTERHREALRQRLSEFDFDYFITLATNHSDFSQSQMQELLKGWDARINRYLNGPKWRRRPDERLLWHAFLEKAETNPHWHLLCQLDASPVGLAKRERMEALPDKAERSWRELVPRGDFDCQLVEDSGVVSYVTKNTDLSRDGHYLTHREFETS